LRVTEVVINDILYSADETDCSCLSMVSVINAGALYECLCENRDTVVVLGSIQDTILAAKPETGVRLVGEKTFGKVAILSTQTSGSILLLCGDLNSQESPAYFLVVERSRF